jgi:hypothetical protein
MMLSRPIQIEITKLFNSVQKGKSAKELMAEFDIPSQDVLKSAITHVMQQTGQDIQIPGLVGQASIDAQYNRGKRVDPAMLEGTQMPEGPSNLDKVAQQTPQEAYDIRISDGVLTIKPTQ